MQLLPPQHAKQFILAGNSYFTVKNTVTGNFMHFHVLLSKSKTRYFVEVKKGSVVETEGGEKDGNWVYMGEIKNGRLALTPKSRVKDDSTEFRAFDWLLRRLQDGSWQEGVVIYRHVWCGRCGRHLLDEVSVEDGLGAHCYYKLTGRRRSTAGRRMRSNASTASPVLIPGVAARMIATAGLPSDEAQQVWEEMERQAGK